MELVFPISRPAAVISSQLTENFSGIKYGSIKWSRGSAERVPGAPVPCKQAEIKLTGTEVERRTPWNPGNRE